MGFWDIFRKKRSSATDAPAPKVAHLERQESLQELTTEEAGQIDELLSKLYLLSNRLIQMQERYLKPSLLIHGIVDHEDSLEQIFSFSEQIESLFKVIEQDSYLVISVAQKAKALLMRSHNLHKEEELLPQQRRTFSEVLKMEDKLKQINDSLSYCIFTVTEIHARMKEKSKVVYEQTIHDELQSVADSIDKIVPLVTDAITHLSDLSHIHHKSSQMGMKHTVADRLHLEKEDVEKLAQIYSQSYRQLAVAAKHLWESEDGPWKFRLTLQEHILPNLQQALRYEDALDNTVKTIKEQLLGLDMSRNADVEQQQMKLLTLSQSIRAAFVQLNNNTVPGLIKMIAASESREKIEAAIRQTLAVLKEIYQSIQMMQKVLTAKEEIRTRNTEFVMGMNG